MSENQVQSFGEDRDRLKEMLEYGDAEAVLGRKGREQAGKSVEIMSQKIEKLIEEGDEAEVKISRQERDTVYSVVSRLIHIVTFNGITSWLRDFTLQYVQFCQKWNNKTLQDDEFKTKLFAIKRIVTSQETMQDTAEMLRRLLNKADKVLERDPESLKLSRHYMKQIRSDSSQDKEKCHE